MLILRFEDINLGNDGRLVFGPVASLQNIIENQKNRRCFKARRARFEKKFINQGPLLPYHESPEWISVFSFKHLSTKVSAADTFFQHFQSPGRRGYILIFLTIIWANVFLGYSFLLVIRVNLFR